MLQARLLRVWQSAASRLLEGNKSLPLSTSLQEPNGSDIQELGATVSLDRHQVIPNHTVPRGPSYSSVGRWKGLWAKLNGCWQGRMKRMTTADEGKEGKAADWTRASESTSAQRTTVPSSADTWGHLTLGGPAQALPSSSDSEIQPILNMPTCRPHRAPRVQHAYQCTYRLL